MADEYKEENTPAKKAAINYFIGELSAYQVVRRLYGPREYWPKIEIDTPAFFG